MQGGRNMKADSRSHTDAPKNLLYEGWLKPCTSVQAHFPASHQENWQSLLLDPMLVFNCRHNIGAFQAVPSSFITISVTGSILSSEHTERNFRFITSEALKRVKPWWQLIWSTVYNFAAHFQVPLYRAPGKLSKYKQNEVITCNSTIWGIKKNVHRSIPFIILLGIIPSELWRN